MSSRGKLILQGTVMAMIRVGKYTQEGYVKGGGLKFLV